MSDYWWNLNDAWQRTILILGGVVVMMLLMGIYPFVVPSSGMYYVIFLSSLGLLSCLLLTHGLDKWCFNPDEGVVIKVNDGVRTYTQHYKARYVNNQIKALLDCLETNFWVLLMNEDYPDYTALIDYTHSESLVIPYTSWNLIDKMLAYEDYLRQDQDPPDWFPPHGSTIDMSFREMFESSIASYFGALPEGLALMYLKRLGERDTPEGLWAAINNEMLLTHGRIK